MSRSCNVGQIYPTALSYGYDLERFLRKGTLTSHVADKVMRELGMRIVATMRSKEFDSFKERDDEIARDARAVLRYANVIKLEERTASQEKLLLHDAYPDLNLGPGLGESFIAGPELKHAMTLVMQQDAPLYGLLTIGEELDLLDPFSALIF